MPNVFCVSDYNQNSLVIVDVSNMTHKTTVQVGSKPYPVDLISPNLVLVSTRGLRSIQPVDVRAGTALSPVAIPHKPRSTTSHPRKNMALIGGADKALTTVLDTSTFKPIVSVGTGNTFPRRNSSRRDFGGDMACGHPAWGPEDTILHLDRIDRRIDLYDLNNKLISWVNTPTSAHHMIFIDGDGYLALCEGNPVSRINPSVLKFHISKKGITIDAHTFLPIPLIHASQTGGHHLTYDRNRNFVYVGTNEGRMFTLSASDLSPINVVDTGPGCGHVTICPQMNLAVATNHTGISMTVIDLNSGRVAGSIGVSQPAVGNQKTQGHTSKWFANSSRLVSTAAQDGLILEIDPSARKVTRSFAVGSAYLIQGCFV